MNVIVNGNIFEIAPNSRIEGLLKSLDKPLNGSALAVNGEIISRTKWAEYRLCEGDNISLFQAIAGG
ncbi:sulfur carrier protein ThiS [Psychromonas antarctica]|uniref:sulfur carrier protein ThiS n=1 Tax=Psychromonas antarctica TaxID=67573 RepID=UPI001EE845D3|nr:sulfur carrier protein ThiS [Psychromonas antarctica]MCG6200748.1 sulfur carrier protein ThiS [Psychromonas antarctica]